MLDLDALRLEHMFDCSLPDPGSSRSLLRAFSAKPEDCTSLGFRLCDGATKSDAAAARAAIHRRSIETVEGAHEISVTLSPRIIGGSECEDFEDGVQIRHAYIRIERRSGASNVGILAERVDTGKGITERAAQGLNEKHLVVVFLVAGHGCDIGNGCFWLIGIVEAVADLEGHHV
jgi:hypothetical protein